MLFINIIGIADLGWHCLFRNKVPSRRWRHISILNQVTLWRSRMEWCFLRSTVTMTNSLQAVLKNSKVLGGTGNAMIPTLTVYILTAEKTLEGMPITSHGVLGSAIIVLRSERKWSFAGFENKTMDILQSTLDISKLLGLFFTSPNYPKCKLICTSGNLDL